MKLGDNIIYANNLRKSQYLDKRGESRVLFHLLKQTLQ